MQSRCLGFGRPLGPFPVSVTRGLGELVGETVANFSNHPFSLKPERGSWTRAITDAR